MTAPDFDWDDDECVIVREQKAVAVYANTKGAIVIRDQGDYFAHEDDTWIVIQPDRAVMVARAILALADELGATAKSAPLALPPPADGAAERQRRYRERKRNGETVTRDVTDRDSVALTDNKGALL